MIYDAIIIGSGPAGLAAAIYTSRANLKTLIIGGDLPGGQLMLTTDVEDYPGFSKGIQGPDLMKEMMEQAKNMGAELITGNATSVNFSQKPFTIYSGNKKYKTRTVVIATGASAKWMGIESEKRLIGKGVSACAVCDGAFFKDKDIVVIGGGDTAMREAIFLTKYAKSIKVIHRRDKLRAFPILQDRAFENKKISFVWDTVTEEFLGEKMLEGINVMNVKTGKTSIIKCQGAFVAIGHKPNTDFLKGHIKLDKKGYILTKDEVKTGVPGIFAAGDVHDIKYKQASTAAGSGTKAALEIDSFLENGSI